MSEQEEAKLTAYALGELSPEEAAAMQRELSASPEKQRELEAIESTLALIREELEQDSPALSTGRRQSIEAAARGSAGAESEEPIPTSGPSAPVPDRQLETPKVVPFAPRRRRGRLVFGAGMVATAAAAAAGLFFVVRSEPGSSESDLMESQAHYAMTKGAPGLAASAASPATMADPQERKQEAKPDDGDKDEKGRFNRERYDHIVDNPFVRVDTDPRSTFSIDVDTASYALMRRHLNEGKLPPKGAVRIEEMLNYFSYEYPEPTGPHPFSVTTDVASAPWSPEHRLVRIGLKGKHVEPKDVPGTNLVFLIDVSGSMSAPNKLPLLKRAFGLLVNQLDARDSVSMVVYAGASGLVLPPTPGDRKQEILSALERLDAGGSTNGGEGIRLAYQMAKKRFVRGGINRVLLATDGDFNVGTTSESELVDLIEDKAKSGVFLSVLGLGGGNYNDSTLEKLADKGNGNYAYIDSIREARKVLVEQATGTLMTIAKDVKIQVEFNPAQVAAFRLIGYENRVLAHQDFNDDKKDAGEIGADHTVTALYEVVPAGGAVPTIKGDELKYQARPQPTPAAASGELLTVKLRYKQPSGTTSQLFETAVRDGRGKIESANAEFRFTAAVAEFGMLLRDSPYKGKSSFQQVLSLASDSKRSEAMREFSELVKKAQSLKAGAKNAEQNCECDPADPLCTCL